MKESACSANRRLNCERMAQRAVASAAWRAIACFASAAAHVADPIGLLAVDAKAQPLLHGHSRGPVRLGRHQALAANDASGVLDARAHYLRWLFQRRRGCHRRRAIARLRRGQLRQLRRAQAQTRHPVSGATRSQPLGRRELKRGAAAALQRCELAIARRCLKLGEPANEGTSEEDVRHCALRREGLEVGVHCGRPRGATRTDRRRVRSASRSITIGLSAVVRPPGA